MTMWLLVLLVVVVVVALVWQSERRSRMGRGSGGGSRGMAEHGERARTYETMAGGAPVVVASSGAEAGTPWSA